MRKAILSSALLIAAAVALSVLLPSKPAGAAGTGCACGEVGVTPYYTGTGSTCDAAKNDLRAQAYPYVDAYCVPDGSCQRILVGDCVLQADCTYSVYGYIDFRCWACID